jgi:hypothetical protein
VQKNKKGKFLELKYFEIKSINSTLGTDYENVFIKFMNTPLKRLENFSSRLCTIIALNMVCGRVRACKIIYDPIENCKDNYVMELNHTNEEIMSSRVIRSSDR